MNSGKNIKTWLGRQNDAVFVFYAALAAFFTYSCMYAFRKPYTVATFDDLVFFGVHYKIWLITAQVIGYTISKFIGIKMVSEMKANNRAVTILVVIGVALLALLFFAITPAPYNIVFLFLNGLPLGIVWGLVFAYLEGRRTTEMLGAAVSVSFIFASGFVKSIGKTLILNFSVSEFWMPFVTGIIFTIPLVVSVFLLNQLPEPADADKESRTVRIPMSKQERADFFKRFSAIIILFVLTYILLTILRDIRDNFAAELWIVLGQGNAPEIFTVTEIPVGIGVLAVISLMVLIRNNFLALTTAITTVIVGFLIVIITTASFQFGLIGNVLWMILVGFGLYLGYIAYHAFLFERFIATFKYVSNIGFIMYLADSFGYLGSVASFFAKNFFSKNVSWLNFYTMLAYSLSIVGIVFCLLAYVFVRQKYRKAFPETKSSKSIIIKWTI